MLTKPRLDVFEAKSLGQKLKNGLLEKMFGMLPAAVHVMTIPAKIDRSGFQKAMRTFKRTRTRWSRGEEELMSAFVSYLNHCKF